MKQSKIKANQNLVVILSLNHNFISQTLAEISMPFPLLSVTQYSLSAYNDMLLPLLCAEVRFPLQHTVFTYV